MAQEHQNPDYYAETASMNPSQQHQSHQSSSVPPPQYQEHMQQYYPPPPPSGAPGGPGAPQAGSADDEHPPPKPPRPQSSQQQNPNYYAPPPGTQEFVSPVSPGKPPVPGTEPFTDAVGGSSKPTFKERFYQWSTKAGVPINKMTNKLGSEAFWPSTMDVECDKAARILKSFCKDGFYTTSANATTPSPTTGPKGSTKALVKIPPSAIASAAGLAIFTTFRTGLHISGAGGSGVVVSRLPDGTWSPPSGFLVHTLGAGLLVGLDIYDCVCVLRTPQAVAAFSRPRLSLGGEVGLAAGPVGAGAAVDAALPASTKPVWGYVKSRGFYAGAQADGTVVLARPDANAAFYGVKGVRVEDILRGAVPTRGPEGMWPDGARRLVEVLKSADGRRDVDEGVLKDVGSGPTPGDLGVADDEKEGRFA